LTLESGKNTPKSDRIFGAFLYEVRRTRWVLAAGTLGKE
jgi:hypothetical protein